MNKWASAFAFYLFQGQIRTGGLCSKQDFTTSRKVQQSSKYLHFKGGLVDFVVKDLNVHLNGAKREIQEKLKLMLPIFNLVKTHRCCCFLSVKHQFMLGMPNSLIFPKFEPFSMLYTYGFRLPSNLQDLNSTENIWKWKKPTYTFLTYI